MCFFVFVVVVGFFFVGCFIVENILEIGEFNIGLCFMVFVLYDVYCYVEFEGDIVYENVGFIGEIFVVWFLCSYYGDCLILVNLEIDLGFGCGLVVFGFENIYDYFVVVIWCDMGMIEKEVFLICVCFGFGEDCVFCIECVEVIFILCVILIMFGGNFEIFVGFELIDEQIVFNCSGWCFCVVVGQDQNLCF